MTPMSKSLAAAAGLLLAVSVSGCAGAGADGAGSVPANCEPAHGGVQTLSGKTLSVSVYVSPPATLSENNTFSGIEPEIVTELAKAECLAVRMRPVAGAALIAGLQAGRADVGIGAIYHTPERAETLKLSTPLYQDGMALLSPSTLDGDIGALRGKSVGVVQGTSWIADLRKVLGPDAVHVYQATDGMITDLRNGRVDAAVLNSSEAGHRAKQSPGLKVAQVKPDPGVAASRTRSDVVLAIRRDATGLAKAFDDDIRGLLAKGTIGSILTKYGIDPRLAGGAG
ncbi:polar amino acid transport system substrate-binding protein [Actinomadura luteofluorescens]|uniref:Polar amino acid transport system substrate-binding protein n=1 Tax=Actinomadura luteofluorescens TaxID=46163 RepID=A0A7Y9EBB0_9ACTN|nr:transporter substrate-binding domain-containing protein [Actinomadura luteofluorescens]NYD44640.1 polar amino acid transport system substrate-binding protein [Actinomadura luteofluorescens]